VSDKSSHTAAYLATAPRLPLRAAGVEIDAREARADDMLNQKK